MPGRLCKCPDPENGSLPSRVRQAVISNRISVVRSWLAEEGSDVNAADHLGFPLLYTACATGRKEVVEELLKRPELHLNPKLSGIEKYVVGRDCRDFTPLCIAAYQGNEECVKLLLTAALPCQIDPNVWLKHSGTALMIACDNNNWNVVSLIFRHQGKLSLEELDHLLPKAKKNNRMKLVFSILYELFSKSVVKREWSRSTSLLKRINSQADLHVPLAKAAIALNVDEMRSILQRDPEQDSSGVLLAVAVEGSSEEVVDMLLHHGSHSDDILEHALLLSTMNNNLEVLPALLRRHFSCYRYGTLSQARNIAEDARFRDVERLLSNALDSSAQTYFELRDCRVISPPPPLPVTTSFHQIMSQRNEMVTERKNLVSLDDNCYRNDTSPRGMVIIFNYKEFDGKSEMLREGSDADVNNLQNTFSQMGYTTQVHCNLTEDQTTLNVINFREQERVRRCGCVVVVVMSHGVARQTFHTSDMQVFTVDKLLNLFSDRECPHLRGKAKLFLFNFCRGTDVTYHTDAVRGAHNDMVCVYSAQEGFVCLRHPVLGSPFIRTWCNVLASDAKSTNLDGILKKFMKLYSQTVAGVSAEVQQLNFSKDFWFMPLPTRKGIELHE